MTNPGNGNGDGDGMGGDAQGSDSISGSSSQFNDSSLGATSVHSGAGEVVLIASDRQSFESASVTGGTFSIDGLDDPGTRWIGIDPADASNLMTTFSLVDLSEDSVNLPLVPVSVLEAIFASLESSPDLNQNSAQLVLTVVDAMGTPIPGVTVTFSSGGGTVAYLSVDTWFENANGTDDSGKLLVANAGGVPLPGTQVQLIFGGAIDGEVSVFAVNGAVSLLTVVIGP